VKGVTVTLHRYSKGGLTNKHGNDIGVYDSQIIHNAVFVPGQTAEITQGAEQITDAVQFYFPVGTAVGPLDRIEYPPGTMYEATGDPSNWTSPFTGSTAPERIRAQLVIGATPHTVSQAGSTIA
jgi:hypothetical protein